MSPRAAQVGYHGQQFFVTARKRSLGQGNVFTPVCHSVHRGVCIWEGQHLEGSASRGVCIWRVLHPGGLHLGAWSASGGLHPGGSASRAGVCILGGLYLGSLHMGLGQTTQGALRDTVNKQAAHILLECILVIGFAFAIQFN